jgi:hypothetical protein
MKLIYKIRLFRVIREIILYIEYISQIKAEEKSSPTFNKFNLRVDWIGRIYTVVNLPPEVTQSPDLPKDSRPAFVLEEIKPINDYFKQLRLEELITLGFRPIKGTNDDSFLVIYYFLFKELTWMWIFKLTIFWSIVFTIIKFLF